LVKKKKKKRKEKVQKGTILPNSIMTAGISFTSSVIIVVELVVVNAMI
jgi:hypothetical protein